MTDRDSTTRTRARTPGEEDYPPSTAVYWRVTDPTLSGIFVDTNAMHEGRRQTNTGPAHAGSMLKLSDVLGRRRPKCHPSSRTGENPPYGMIGGIEETSASFEARSAPRSYPTIGVHVGDIMVQGDNLFGDAVNVAARLEALAEPGGICISGAVRDHVGPNLSVGFVD